MVRQSCQKEGHDQHTRERRFERGDLVMVRSYRSGPVKWVPGEVVSVLGPVLHRAPSGGQMVAVEYVTLTSCG